MKNKNIIFNHTLEQYTKKYRNRKYRLIKFTKKEVEEFDKFNKSTEPNFLLKNRKWVLIKDTYYEIPKPIRFTWFRNLNAACQIGACALVAGVVATAVTVPLVLLNRANDPTITIEGADYDIEASHIELHKNSCIVLKQKGSEEIIDVKEVKVGGKTITKETDWSYKDKKVEIKAHAMNSLNIEIKVETKEPTLAYTISVTADTGGTVTGGGTYNAGTSVTVTATPESGYKFDGWYENDTKIEDAGASYTFTVTKNRSLEAKFIDISFESCNWSYIKDACDALETAGFSEDAKAEFCAKFTVNGVTPTSMDGFVGAEREVKLINPDGTEQTSAHKVRVIGTQHDKDENDASLALTFEFKNLISDENGNSLAIVWNDTNDTSPTSTANIDYINSSIRKALCGSGGFNGDFLYAQKGETSFSSTYKNKTILSMLPNDLQEVLKTTKKTVGIGNDYTETPYTDKLFMLSCSEMGYVKEAKEGFDKGFGSPYSYYSEYTEYADKIRIKRQVNNSEVYTSWSKIPINSGQVYQGEVISAAGLNNKTSDNGGGHYWIRSPYKYVKTSSPNAFKVHPDNGGLTYDAVFNAAFGVAPAFCI